MNTVTRAYKLRFYPNAEQEAFFLRAFGAARWVWNRSLEFRQKAWRRRKASVNGQDFSKLLTRLKREPSFTWLKAVPATVLVQKLRDQDTAFKNFFAGRARFPRFKKRGGHESIRFQVDQRVVASCYQPGHLLRVPGLKTPLNVVWSRVPAGTPKMVTISRDPAGRWFVSLAVDEAIMPWSASTKAAGMDLGLSHRVTLDDGTKFEGLAPLRAMLRRLKHLQRIKDRRTKGSNRWKRAKAAVARLHARIADVRRNALHWISTMLIRENQAVCIEDLNLKGMMRNGRLARALADAGLGELIRQLRYKAEWHGRQVFTIGRFQPSSKTCSVCDHRLEDLPLSVRSWICPQCGAEHDRDVNAARNILRWGLAPPAEMLAAPA